MTEGNVFRSLSPEGDLIEGSLIDLGPRLGLYPAGSIVDAAEAFARLVRHFAEREDSRLVLSTRHDGPYVQMLVEPDGTLFAEASSSAYLDEAGQLSVEAEFEILEREWQVPGPTPVACVRSPGNFWRRWSAPIPIGQVTLALLGVLHDVFRVEQLDELWVRYFTWSAAH